MSFILDYLFLDFLGPRYTGILTNKAAIELGFFTSVTILSVINRPKPQLYSHLMTLHK